ncbi:MAG: nucleotidyl transferase AbiEii/AbiGii toxin family protein [Chloroflexia bacterium]
MLRGKGLLTPIQRAFLAVFSGLPDQEHFYLTGGTCLAEFYLGHRLSQDLDLFTGEGELILPFSYRLETTVRSGGLAITVIRRFASFVEFLVGRGEEQVRVDLALDAPFRFEPPLLSEYGIWTNSRPDLLADKVLAYFGRAEPRDAVDLYFLLQEENLDRLLDMAARKDPGFDLYWFAVALNRAADFPDELERWPVQMRRPFAPRDLKATFQRLALDLMERITARK